MPPCASATRLRSLAHDAGIDLAYWWRTSPVRKSLNFDGIKAFVGFAASPTRGCAGSNSSGPV